MFKLSIDRRGRRIRRTALSCLVVAVVGQAAACRDDITPPAPLLGGRPATFTVNGPGTVVVSPSAMHGWVFYDDQHDSTCTLAARCAMVSGPTGAPAGGGSAMLSVGATNQGSALLIADYGGTRFDQITALTYATYRSTADAGNNLAIALQFNVDYDLNDANTSYQGRLVFEPYLANGGSVAQATWQTWDARAGKWWGTKSSVPKGGVLGSNPCVQSSPCTWSQLLAAFPNLGVHATYGALVLKAGSGWASFAGNVDNLTIAVNGAATTFDFEQTAVVAQAHLHTNTESSVVATPALSADADYATGTVVSYAFAPASGYDSLIVTIDDTIAPAQGQLLMDRDHTISAGANRHVVPNAQTTAIGTQIRAVLTATDKVAAYYNFFDWYMDQSSSGNIDSLAANLQLAQYLNLDPVRDSAALRAFDDALAGSVYHYASNGDGTFYSWWDRPSSMSAAREPVGGRVSAARTGRRSIPPRAKLHRRGEGAARASTATMQLSQPLENTLITYVNGINTAYDDGQGHGAFPTLRKLIALLDTVPRFQDNAWVMYDVFYNRTSSAQVADNQRSRVYCAQRGLSQETHRSRLAIVLDYARCTGATFVDRIIYNDYLEAARQWMEIKLRLPVAEPDAARLTQYTLDNRWQHTIYVAHSQGNMMVAQALARAAQTEGHPLANDANCAAVVALASPINQGDYPLDSYHLTGFSVRGDLVPTIGMSDFGAVDTPLSNQVDAEVAASQTPELDRLRLGFLTLHGVDDSYLLQQATARLIVDAIVRLHKECVTGSVNITASAYSVAPGDSVLLSSTVLNENGRPLPDHPVHYATQSPWATLSGSYFEALIPRADTLIQVIAESYAPVTGHAQIAIPVGSILVNAHETLTTYWVADSVKSWDSSVDFHMPSAPSWSGTPGDCSRKTQVSDGKNGITYISQRCYRVLDLPSEERPAESYSVPDARYLSRIASYKVHDYDYQTGQLLDARQCGFTNANDFGQYCWDRIAVFAYDANDHLIARGQTCMLGCTAGGSFNRATPRPAVIDTRVKRGTP